MKINIKKVVLMILYGIAIGLGAFASSLALLTDYEILKYGLLFLTYLTGISFVRIRRKYPLLLHK